MLIYSVLIKIWKLQIDLLWIKKIKYRMRPRILCPCCGAPLVLTSVSAESLNSNIAMQSRLKPLSWPLLWNFFHVRIIRKKVFVFPGATHCQSGAWAPLQRLEVICWVILWWAVGGGGVAVVSRHPAELFWKGNNPSLQLPRTKSLTQTFPLNRLAVTPVVSLSLKGFCCTCS